MDGTLICAINKTIKLAKEIVPVLSTLIGESEVLVPGGMIENDLLNIYL